MKSVLYTLLGLAVIFLGTYGAYKIPEILKMTVATGLDKDVVIQWFAGFCIMIITAVVVGIAYEIGKNIANDFKPKKI